jgi:four helix bundle protein
LPVLDLGLMHQFGFEKLQVWQDGRNLVKDIYHLTQNFPLQEKYGLISQVRRSAISVCANIAEGSCRRGFKEQYHFTSLAFGSLLELLNHLILAQDIGYISSMDLLALRKKIQPLSVKLNNLRTYQEKNIGSSIKSFK